MLERREERGGIGIYKGFRDTYSISSAQNHASSSSNCGKMKNNMSSCFVKRVEFLHTTIVTPREWHSPRCPHPKNVF
jgi:hypothetical protein